ncbi:MAG: carbon-nitrogen hydrolase family protein [Candidatus Aminicenantes bacterium]|nr:MAG: carbon-nitrogen hydrolase family protein [Candidatus Aminicenantes bacterium]
MFIGSRSFQINRTIRVAMCQIFCLDGDRSGNFARIKNALSEAKQADADIACFPETALLGWVNPEAYERSHPIPGKDSDYLCRLAAKHRIHLCIGLAEKEEDRLYDSVILIDDKGQILLKHRKMNILTELMTPPYAQGKDVGTVETKFGKIGLLICADTFKTDILKQMTNLKPDLVLVPYGWAAKQAQWPEHGKKLQKTVTKAARMIGAPVVGVDLVGEITHGPWTGMTYGGQSVTTDANGRILAIAKDRDRDVMIIQIPIY